MSPKRIGRPPIAGRMVLVRLPEWLIAAARMLGGGNMSAGVRRALELAAAEKVAADKLDGLE